ncbi:MAG: type II toxin-antitoxin system VapC family toxin [Bosea sp. (in: a-proteobacteria)]
MILDTSVLYDSIVDGPRSVAARRSMTAVETLRAPDLIEIEIASALTKAVRRRELTSEEALLSFDRARKLMPDTEPSHPLLNRAFDLALELAHPTPDCIFLALAERDNIVLLTSDARMALKLGQTRFARLVQLVEA